MFLQLIWRRLAQTSVHIYDFESQSLFFLSLIFCNQHERTAQIVLSVSRGWPIDQNDWELLRSIRFQGLKCLPRLLIFINKF